MGCKTLDRTRLTGRLISFPRATVIQYLWKDATQSFTPETPVTPAIRDREFTRRKPLIHNQGDRTH